MSYRKSPRQQQHRPRARPRPLFAKARVTTAFDGEGREVTVIRKGKKWFGVNPEDEEDLEALKKNFDREGQARVGQNLED